MNKREAQTVWKKAGFYTGGIDGDIGPKSRMAMQEIRARHASDFTFKYDRRIKTREMIACTQVCLNVLGFEAGAVDGLDGHNTREALSGFMYWLVNGEREVVSRTPSPQRPSANVDIPHQREVAGFYGDPARGEAYMRSRLRTIQLPFKMRIDYNLSQRTSRMTVHEKCAPSLYDAMAKVHDEYGINEMRRLGIDRYAGGFNYRKMRGGSSWSMHAYGCAVDFYARPNGLRMKCPQALFCGREYRRFLDIMEAHNWLPAIRLWGADAMHFQQARI